jgi:high-affinity nickel-transport protein
MTRTPAASTALLERRRWDRADSRRLARLLGVVGLLHAAGWGGLVLAAQSPAAQVVTTAHAVSLVGLGVTAYLFGVRHAFDADHIAVIDGTTRTLTAAGARPLSVGFWFSLGHSSVVVVMALLVVGGTQVATTLLDAGSTLHTTFAAVGSGAAGVFLWVLGLVNLVALVGLVRVRRRAADGLLTDDELNRVLDVTGPVARVLGRLTRGVRHPAQVFPVGLLMGLGFDTATEVALLVLAATAAVTLPWYAVLVLPVLFAAGMSLFDTLDGAFMNVAYDWAFRRPLRKLTYNVVVTALTVAISLAVGTAQLVTVLRDTLGLDDPVTGWVGGVAASDLGLAAVVAFTVCWLAGLGWWRWRGRRDVRV